MCVEMSRNVGVEFAEGYSEVLDDKKNRGLYDFLQPIWGGGYIRGGYIRGGYTRDFTVVVPREREHDPTHPRSNGPPGFFAVFDVFGENLRWFFDHKTLSGDPIPGHIYIIRIAGT